MDLKSLLNTVKTVTTITVSVVGVVFVVSEIRRNNVSVKTQSENSDRIKKSRHKNRYGDEWEEEYYPPSQSTHPEEKHYHHSVYNVDNKKIYIHNVEYSATRSDLEQTFSQFGSVINMHIPMNREEGRIRGIAFIEFETVEAVNQALNYRGNLEINGRRIFLEEYLEDYKNKKAHIHS